LSAPAGRMPRRGTRPRTPRKPSSPQQDLHHARRGWVCQQRWPGAGARIRSDNRSGRDRRSAPAQFERSARSNKTNNSCPRYRQSNDTCFQVGMDNKIFRQTA
jgi:hypothetical protein